MWVFFDTVKRRNKAQFIEITLDIRKLEFTHWC